MFIEKKCLFIWKPYGCINRKLGYANNNQLENAFHHSTKNHQAAWSLLNNNKTTLYWELWEYEEEGEGEHNARY